MGSKTSIEWCDHTFNHVIGCTKVHTGCQHCYAESLAKRTGRAIWGPAGTRSKTSDEYWRQPFKWNGDCPQLVRPRVFCASLADVFEDWAGEVRDHRGLIMHQCEAGHYVGRNAVMARGTECDECERLATVVSFADLRRDLFALIDATPNLDWLLLTKRPENVPRMWALPANGRDPGDPLYARRENVWVGTSVSDQETADLAIPELLKCRDLSPVLFVSAEPLVGPVDLQLECPGCSLCWAQPEGNRSCFEEGRAIDWVIVGGESGGGARRCDVSWIRSIRDQCGAADVPVFVKQLGAKPIADGGQLRYHDKKGGDIDTWPAGLQVRQFPNPSRTNA